jgi:hypothetical protein
MFKTQLLLSAARIDELGQYRSPNICFIDDEDDRDGGQDDQDGGPEADEEDGDGDAAEGDEADGEEDGEGEGDADHEGEAEDGRQESRSSRQEVERARPRRADEVIRDNKRAAKEALARAEQAERRAEAAERAAERAERAATERRASETAESERLRLDSMTTEERYDYNLRKQDEAHRTELNGVKFQIWDSSDRAAFRDLAREDPLIGRVKDKVEAEFQRLRKEGRPVEREIIANQEIAKMMRAQRVAAGTRQKARGADRVQRETAKPVRARGNEAPPARARRGQEDTPAARRARLMDVQI